jgi:hypothetical protein
LLQGIVTDNADDSTHFWQQQSRTGKPVEIDAEQILHIKDETPGDLSYVASIIPVIRTWSYARSHAVMKYLQRVAAPNAVGTIDPAYFALGGEDGYQGSKTLGVPTEVWDYLTAVIKAQSTDTAFVMPVGTKLEYPALAAKPPIEIDQYLVREITTHLIPVHILDTLGNSIGTTSQPALELFQLIVNGWREINSRPFEDFFTKILELNGFEGWQCSFQWWPIVPEDKSLSHKVAIDGLMNRAISINEYRSMHDMPQLSDEELSKMGAEYQEMGGGML